MKSGVYNKFNIWSFGLPKLVKRSTMMPWLLIVLTVHALSSCPRHVCAHTFTQRKQFVPPSFLLFAIILLFAAFFLKFSTTWNLIIITHWSKFTTSSISEETEPKGLGIRFCCCYCCSKHFGSKRLEPKDAEICSLARYLTNWLPD